MKKKYKILSIILALALVIGSITAISIFSSSAETFKDNNGISWTVTENKPGWAIKPTDRSAITGHVVIPSEYKGQPINMINNQAFDGCTELTSVVIPDSVTQLANYAFNRCTSLTSINIPNSVTTIGSYAFKGCTSLTSIEIPNSVTTIYGSAFAGCTSLTSVELPNSITTLSGIFSGCTNLVHVTLPNNITSVSGFDGCTSLTSIEIPNSVTTIGSSAFKGCTSLTSIDIPDGVTSIGASAFEGCTGLTSIEIPNSVTTIGEKVFLDCTSLANITIPHASDLVLKINMFENSAWYNNQPDNVLYFNQYCLGYKGKSSDITGDLVIKEGTTKISDSAFAYCKITSVDIPDSVTELGEWAFYQCTNLKSAKLSNSITTIPKYAFGHCSALTSIEIPNSVTAIGGDAFYNCKSLKSINIPDSVTTIGSSAFEKCTNLATVTIPPSCSFSISSFKDTAWYNSLSDGLVYYGTALVGYKNTKPTGNLVIKEGTTSISGLGGCTGLTSIEIPNSVTKISGLNNCTGLTSIVLPDSVTMIGASAFNGCTGLTSIVLPDSITMIGDSAFKGCTSLTSINIPNSVTTIGAYAFDGCTGLTSIEIPNSVETIKLCAFARCSNLTSIAIPNSVTTIGDSIFTSCTKLSHVTLPNSISTITADMFFQCDGLTSIVIPDSVTTIGDSAFYGCNNLTNVDYGKNVKTIDTMAFYLCSSLATIDIPNTVTTIGSSAFEKCKGVENIIIPKNVSEIKDHAFAECGTIENLTMNCSFDVCAPTIFYNDTFVNVILGENTTEIGDEFSNQESLETIVIPQTTKKIKDTAFTGSSNVTITTTSNSTAHKFATANNIPVKIIDAVNTIDPVSFEVTCDKSGYEFTVYKVAELETTTSPYEVRYNSLIDSIDDEIFNGDSDGLLKGLDEVLSNDLTEIVGTYNTDTDGSSKTFDNLEPGIYYVRATNFPANVYGVQNSVFALPYYDAINGWIYEIDPIPLATKVDESNPEIVKTITNSTKENVNFTDVSLGDTVNFEIEASRVGSANVVESKDFKLNNYVVSDIMESGLTLNQDSFVVTLEDIDGNTIATLDNTTDYIVNIVASEGVDTTFTVSLTPEYLADDEFYSSANVVIAYSAVLNEFSTREFDGNYNTATNLTYTNKTNVSATVDGNTVYAYTFGIEVNKYNDAGTPLAGSEFALYLTEEDAKAMKNEIATGISTDTGKVEFLTADDDVIRLASGTYYIVETKATENYNRYTDVIPVTITVEYGETEVNGTYIETAPENGVQLVEVKNSMVIIPNTGGNGALYRYIIALAFAVMAVTLVVLKKRNTKKLTATK